MIKLTCGGSHSYRTEYVAAGNVARISEAPNSSAWHGIRSYVRTFDGAVLECNETAADIRRMVEEAIAEGE